MIKPALLVIICWLCLNLFSSLQAKEITILYTGQTHAMLYPCNCPREPDGGIARRAALIKKLRKDNSAALLLDSGGFFSGGMLDEYTQNVELDRKRALINLKAMGMMRYDALAIGDDEFNFGTEFLEENTGKAGLTFLSCNITTSSSGVNTTVFRPYIIKEAAGAKIGIIGVTTLTAKQKASGLEFIEPKLAVKQAVQDLKKNNADIIVLLSHLGESGDLNLIKDIPGIDILIMGHNYAKEDPYTKIGGTLILRPSWQGRRLGKLSLTLKDNKIADYKVEELRLSDKISDDTGILSILPRCFSDDNCRQAATIGICEERGTLESHCRFAAAAKISLLVIAPKQCRVCNTERVVKNLKALFPGLAASYLYYPDAKAAKLINDFGITALPIYLFGKEISREKGFDDLRDNLEARGDFYMLKPQIGGISYFLKREKKEGKLDLLISLFDKEAPELLAIVKDYNPAIHFLAVEQENNFGAAKGGILEIEEDLRSVCVQKYYPQSFWNYISCRSRNINSSWWQDCLENLDTEKIKNCARGDEAGVLLRENIRLNQELEVNSGPTYLLDNQEIFSSRLAPKKEDLEKIINKK